MLAYESLPVHCSWVTLTKRPVMKNVIRTIGNLLKKFCVSVTSKNVRILPNTREMLVDHFNICVNLLLSRLQCVTIHLAAKSWRHFWNKLHM